MAEKKISQLTAKGATVADTDLLVVSESAGGGAYTTKSITGANVKALVTDANLSTSDITTNDVSTSKHGFAPKAPNDATKYLDGTGAWSTPASGSSGGKFGIADSTGAYTYYTTLGAAITAASSGQTIEFFTDYTETGATTITIKDGVNINGNGHTYTLNNSGTTNAFRDNGVTVICEIYNLHITRTGGATVSNTDNMCFSQTASGSVIKCTGVFMNNTNGVCGRSDGTVIGISCLSVGSYTWFNTNTIVDSYFENTTNQALYNFSGEARNCTGIATTNQGIYSQSASGVLYNCFGKSTSNNGINNVGKIYNCIAISTSGVALSMASASEATNSTAISSSGQGLDGNGHLAFNCRFISSSSYGASGGSSAEHYNCIHESSSNIAVFGYVGLKLYRGVAYSKWNNAGGHAFSQWSSGSGSVLNNMFLRVTNSGANCINAGAATTFNYSQNAYLGATTSVNANVTQGLANTEDNQGNLVL